MPPPVATRRALFLTPETPALGQGGGALRSASLLEYLRPRYQVEVATLRLRPHSKTLLARAARNALRLVRGTPPLFDRYSGYKDQLPAGEFGLAVIEHFWCASYAEPLRPRCARLVLDLHNIESQLARTHARAVRGAARWASLRFAAMYERLERDWLPRFDTVLVASEADRARLAHPDIRVFPNALPWLAAPEVAEVPAVVFSGNLEYHPNLEAVRWFARDIWPRFRHRAPEAEWRLIGRNPEAVAAVVRGVPGVRLIGPVEDAVAALAQGRVCVAPLLSGSGTRFKILEAWAARRAVVSTALGAEGLGARHGEQLWIADTAAEFADAIARLWEDAELRQRLGAAGRELYEQRFSWRAAWAALDAAGGL
jgi:glycosyltransferase involved in cell wall biosynthesis